MDAVTLVHISDLHFGGQIFGGGYRYKQNGHDPRALEALTVALDKIVNRKASNKLLLLISGDVSARGAPNELALYRTVRDNGVAFHAFGSLAPLALGFGRCLDIPGNHDFWSGQLWILPNPVLSSAVRGRFFPNMPNEIIPLGSHVLSIHGLCSTSGANSIQQALAVGAFAPGDLQNVTDELRNAQIFSRQRGLIHFPVLMIHHSPSNGNPVVHGLSNQARRDLEKLVRLFSIRVVLCGHAHKSLVRPSTASSFAETRCATTLQSNIRVIQQQRREFLVHRINEQPNAVNWSVDAWTFDGAQFLETQNWYTNI